MVDKIKRFLTYNSFAPLLTVVCNLVLAYVVYFVCRIVFNNIITAVFLTISPLPT